MSQARMEPEMKIKRLLKAKWSETDISQKNQEIGMSSHLFLNSYLYVVAPFFREYAAEGTRRRWLVRMRGL